MTSEAPTRAQRVHDLMLSCLYSKEETQEAIDSGLKGPADAVVIEGITSVYGFRPSAIEKAKPVVLSLLKEMDLAFWENTGGGYSFLQLPFDRDGQHWAEHRTCESLVLLGLTCGYARYCLPREYWSALPGGVPYITFFEPKPT